MSKRRARLGTGAVMVALIAAGAAGGWVANDLHNGDDDSPDGYSDEQYDRLLDACVAAVPERMAGCMTAIDKAEAEGFDYEEVRDVIAEAIDGA